MPRAGPPEPRRRASSALHVSSDLYPSTVPQAPLHTTSLNWPRTHRDPPASASQCWHSRNIPPHFWLQISVFFFFLIFIYLFYVREYTVAVQMVMNHHVIAGN